MKKEDIKILIVDDEPDIIEIVSYNLIQEGYQIFTARNGKEAIQKAKKIIPQLIILDVMMPKMDGIESCKLIRGVELLDDTIIIFFTARTEDYAQLAGLEAGADVYLTKPIRPKVLVSKVNALLRRFTKKSAEQKNLITIGNIIINRELYIVTKDTTAISLPKKEFELLYLLASQPNKVFKRDVIMHKVWGSNVVVGDRTIDVHIRKLRKKIGDNLFKTVKGVGYKFVHNEV